MAKIKINLPNESFNFEIAGNEPTRRRTGGYQSDSATETC